MKKLVTIAAAAFLCAGCGYKVDKAGAGGENSNLAPGAQLSFANVFAATIRPVCLECHAAPGNAGGFNLETYAAFSDSVRRTTILNAVKSRFMPDSQGRSLTEQQRSLLVAWLEAGAPLDASPTGGAGGSPTGGGSPTPNPLPAPCEQARGPGDDHPGNPCETNH